MNFNGSERFNKDMVERLGTLLGAKSDDIEWVSLIMNKSSLLTHAKFIAEGLGRCKNLRTLKLSLDGCMDLPIDEIDEAIRANSENL